MALETMSKKCYKKICFCHSDKCLNSKIKRASLSVKLTRTGTFKTNVLFFSLAIKMLKAVSKSTLWRRAHRDVDRQLDKMTEDLTEGEVGNETEEEVRAHDDWIESGADTEESEAEEYVQEMEYMDGDVEDTYTDGMGFTSLQQDSTVTANGSDDEFEQETSSLGDSISCWALNFGVSLVALTALLTILQPYHPDLPKDARTILKTRINYTIKEKCGGLYYYFGILTSLHKALSDMIHLVVDGCILRLQINIDGLPLFKSSNMQFWPILGLLVSHPMKEPVIIGLYCGTKKPSSAVEFMQDFVQELQNLEKGFDFKGKNISLKLHTVICDTPARSFIKNTKAHNGYQGCDKCAQRGRYMNRKMSYPLTEYRLRTDESFAQRIDEELRSFC